MDEPKTTRLTESTAVEQPVQADGRTMLEQAFARGSGHISDVPPVAPERTEHSVMEGLPPAKAERIAAMRRELAELQRQLSEAQQRIATELQGRAEDAERLEALETRLQAQEVKAQEATTRTAALETEITSLRSQLSTVTTTADELRRDVASRDAQIEEARRQHRGVTEQLEAQTSLLNETKTSLETRDGELATRTAERDNEQATKSRLERELDDQRKQHREVTSQLESHVASLRDANALIATRDAELTAITSERDTLKGELAASRAKARDVATQLARVGQDLMEGVGDAPPASSSEPPSATPAQTTERPKPPPVPPPRVAAHTEPPKVETILEVTEEPKSISRTGVVLISGVILGCLATIGFVKWRSSSSIAADEGNHPGASPSAALVSERASPSGMPDQVPGTSSTQPTPVFDNVSDRLKGESGSLPTAPAEITADGVIVLPQEAADHRVFVDDRVVPVKNSRAVVPCGTREIRIGSSGTPRTVDVACGGETAVPASARP
ncbi:MAG TPA: hypothetical protein VLB44_21180 [Kofleriaceae bacterium]|nr:hypothetical protein [Kofleriaceae bacterium]